MKKIVLLIIFTAFVGLFLSPVLTNASPGLEPPTPETNIKTDVPPPDSNVENAIGKITNWFFVVVLCVAVIFLLVAGFQFITASGDPDKVNSARQNVMYAMVGVAVAVLAKGIVSLIQGLLKA